MSASRGFILKNQLQMEKNVYKWCVRLYYGHVVSASRGGGLCVLLLFFFLGRDFMVV